jgi:hypothetical protein
MGKKLPGALQKLLQEHQDTWQVDEQELSKRLASAKINYNRWPMAGDETNYSQIVCYSSTFYEMLKKYISPNGVSTRLILLAHHQRTVLSKYSLSNLTIFKRKI